jgi:tetratricopeptide (TPR) repeat protein
MSTGRAHLQQALTLSEQKQFSQALNHTDQALIAFAQDNDLAGYAESYSMRFHIFKHLLTYTNFIGHRFSALSNALTGAQIAQEHNLPNSYVMFINAAKALDQDGQPAKAIAYYDLALTQMQQNAQIKKAVIADTQNHKDAILLEQNDSQAEQRILDNIEIIRNSTDITPYERDVWLSGAYLRLTKAFLNKDPSKATNYKNQAQQIIDSNPELVIRKDQISNIGIHDERLGKK